MAQSLAGYGRTGIVSPVVTQRLKFAGPVKPGLVEQPLQVVGRDRLRDTGVGPARRDMTRSRPEPRTRVPVFGEADCRTPNRHSKNQQ